VTDVLVLGYHALSPRWTADLVVRPERFAEQIETLLARGYRASSFSRAVLAPPAPRTLAVTFDDAFASVAALAVPILARLGVPATVFVPTARAGAGAPMAWPGIAGWLGGPHHDELRGMTWEQLGGLADAGWEIGSHTRTHPRLTSLRDGELGRELEGSRLELEARLGRPCRSLAYPYGDLDLRVVAAARRAGYEAAAGPPGGLPGEDALAVARVGVYLGDDLVRFRAKVSPSLRRLRRSAAWSSVAALSGCGLAGRRAPRRPGTGRDARSRRRGSRARPAPRPHR
jgi:peptidoglycan/xylan/chitin deacetylase (PgdA/CDA1 family)